MIIIIIDNRSSNTNDNINNHFRYLYGLAKVPVGNTSVELIYHLLTSSSSIIHKDDDFLHIYISNSIRTCELYEEGPRKDKYVRLVSLIWPTYKNYISSFNS